MPQVQIVVNVHGGLVQDVFCSDPEARVVLIDWDVEEPGAGVVEVATSDGGRQLALVAEPQADKWSGLFGTDAARAIARAGIDLPILPPMSTEEP